MNELPIKFNKTLNPKLWENHNLKPEVSKALLKIANEFVNFLKVDVTPVDIVLLGSNTNYNYTEYSDIDVHIILNYEEVGNDFDLVKEYFNSKKYIWNMEHDILIKGYEVELYVQDVDEENASTSIYSLLNRKWIKTPKMDKQSIDKHEVMTKSSDFIQRIEMSKGDLESLNDLKDKIKKMRKSGLSKSGEYSIENLVFKTLRNGGYIKKLMGYAKEIYDKKLSLKELN